MEEIVRIMRCPGCDSADLRNLVDIVKGRHMRIYVECAKCHAFVSRFSVRNYTSSRTYESALKGLSEGRSHTTSGRELMGKIEGFTQNVVEEFRRVRKMADAGGDTRRLYEIVEEEKND